MFPLLLQLLAPYRRRVILALVALVVAAGAMLAVGQGLRAGEAYSHALSASAASVRVAGRVLGMSM